MRKDPLQSAPQYVLGKQIEASAQEGSSLILTKSLFLMTTYPAAVSALA
jgi:hypothetical protein